MPTLTGQVLETGTSAPIADVIIRAILVPRASRDDRDGRDDRDDAEVSLGSAATDSTGRFVIAAALPQEQTEARLVLAVAAPDAHREDDGHGGNDDGGARGRPAEPLLVTEPRTVTAEASETYSLRIDAARLEAAGIVPPDASSSGARLSERTSRAVREAAATERALGEAIADRVGQDRAREDDFVANFLPGFVSEAAATSGTVDSGSYPFVVGPQDGQAPGALARDAIAKGVRALHDEGTAGAQPSRRGRRRTRFFFDDAQLQALDAATAATSTGEFTEITESSLFGILGLDESAMAGLPVEVASRERELFDTFREETREEKCAHDVLATPAPASPPPSGPVPEDDTPAQSEDVLSRLSRVIDDLTSPLESLTGGADGPGLAESIQDFAIPVGPADEPRVFDFSTLDVAFDDVWQTVIDRRLEPLARSLHVKADRVLRDSVIPAAERATYGGLVRALDTVRTATQNAGPGVVGARARGGRAGPSGQGSAPDPGTQESSWWEIDTPWSDLETWTDEYDVATEDDGGAVDVDAAPELLVEQIDAILRQPHAFTAFGADERSKAVNFGLLVGYRHVMTPVTYQVGDLVKSITLAPNETREYKTRTVTTRKRAEKELRKHSAIRRDELSETNRAESEIVRKALAKTNFSLNTDGTYNVGFSKGSAKTASGRDGETNSSEVKKAFREAVMSASDELRRERSVEVSFDDTVEFEETATGRIENKNDELTLTCLFFELQRRFRINETIQKATPVILVAQDVPSPDQITNAFLVRHAWVLRRALLDDGFERALDYVQGPIIGDRLEVVALAETLSDHREQVRQLRTQLQALEEQAGRRYEALVQAVEERITQEGLEEQDSFFADLGESLFGGGETTGTAQLREEAARDAEQRAAAKAKEMAIQLQRGVNALNEATQAYNAANRRYRSVELEVARLRLHVKEHILHYMQAIWTYEVDDQRFLRLYQQPVPQFVRQGSQEPIYRRMGPDAGVTRVVVVDGPNDVPTTEQRTAVDFELVPSIDVLPAQHDRPLVEVADPSRLLGFLGNYMIFPMREGNALTDVMLNPYVDEGLRLLDPHDPGNISRPEFADYVCRLRERLTDEQFEQIREALAARYRELLLSSEYAGDEIVVPSGALYLEALPGSTPLLESFKLAHRALDVVTAQEEARRAAIDNLRLAARIVDGDLGDPETDARYDFYGAPGVVTPTPGGDGGSGGGADDGG